MRVTVDLSKASTETLDLTSTLNPRVGDGDLKLPFHIVYGPDDYDMRGKSMDFLSEGSDKKKIHVADTVDESTKGDDPYTGNVTFTFPSGTFKSAGTYDVDKTMFRIINSDDNTVISTVNVKMTVLPGEEGADSSDDVSYDSRMEKVVKDFADKGKASLDDAKKQAQQMVDDAKTSADNYLNDAKKQADELLDDIKQASDEAKGNVAGDTAATAKQAKEQANMNAGLLHDQQGEIGDARGRYMKLVDRENAQDDEINRKEDRQNANENYAAIQIKDAAQDRMIATKADQNYIDNYLSHMHTDPVGVKDEATLKSKYPNGANGIFVTSNGHGWIYTDNQWYDFGPYQSAGLATDVKDKINSIALRNLIKDPEFIESGFPEWTATNDLQISTGHPYFGHKSLRVTNNSDNGLIYSKPIAVTAGDILSFSTKVAFYSADPSSNAMVGFQYYVKETDPYGNPATHSQDVIWSLNLDNSTKWHELSRNALIVPEGVNYVRVYMGFDKGDTSAFEISEPLLVISDRIGPYGMDELPAMLDKTTNNLYPDPNYTSVSSLIKSNLTITDNNEYVNNHHVIVVDATSADASDTTHPPYMATPAFDVKTSQLSFYTGYAYAKPTSGEQMSVEIDLYTSKPESINVAPLTRYTKQIDAPNTSYNYFSFNNLAVPGNAHYARIIYRVPAGGKAWLMNPIVKSEALYPLMEEEMPMAKPRSLHFVNPFYTVGGEGRKYIWIKFDQVIADYYTDQQIINWKDWIGNSAGPADDFSEDVWYVDVGPQATNKDNFLAYNVQTNNLEVVPLRDKFHIPVISWNEKDGFYGSFVDEANKRYETLCGRSEHTYDHLTKDMLGQLVTKENEIIDSFDQNDFVFGLVADNHHAIKSITGADEPLDDNPDYTGMAYAKVANDINLDANFNLGDSVLSNPKNCTASLMNTFRRVPAKDWVYVEGNHDRNVFAPILSKVGYNNIVNRHHLLFDKNFHFGNGENSSYYYVDYDNRKIRVIVLDLYDIGPAHDNVYNDDAGYRQGQLEWLINTALKVEDGWQVIVMTHQPPIPGMPENNLGYNSDALIKILESFKAGTSVEIKKQDEVFHDGTFDLDLQTNFTKPGTIIAVLSGHAHNDFTITQNGINYVQSCCGYIDVLLYHSQHGKPAKYGQRDQYTYSAICFDICILNTTNRTLKFKRFGFGKDRQISY